MNDSERSLKIHSQIPLTFQAPVGIILFVPALEPIKPFHPYFWSDEFYLHFKEEKEFWEREDNWTTSEDGKKYKVRLC